MRAAVFAVCLSFPATLAAGDPAALIARIKAVGPEGAGAQSAAAAWAELSKFDATAIIPLLSALDDASPRAANWLRSALDAIVERQRAAKKPLPMDEIRHFLADKRHDGHARRLAYELIRADDPTAENRLLPTFLDDPSLELRFEAVAKGFQAAKALPKDSGDAKAQLRRLIQSSRDVDQIEEISKELEARGDAINFVQLYGFIVQWRLCGSFDNVDGKGYRGSYPPEHNLDLAAAMVGKGGKSVRWFPYATTDKLGMVDLNKAIGKDKNAVAYGLAIVDSPESRPVEIRAASATALKLFVNGREVLQREAYHQSFTIDSYIAPAQFKKGKNTILIKVCQNDQKEPFAQEWRFQLRVTDALGTPVPLTVEPVAKEKAGQ